MAFLSATCVTSRLVSFKPTGPKLSFTSSDEECDEDEGEEGGEGDSSSDTSEERRPRPLPRVLLTKENKRTGKERGRKKRDRYDYEQKAKTVAYYDTLPLRTEDGTKVGKGERLQAACKEGPVLVDYANTVRAWVTRKGRRAIELVVGRPIADYTPGANIVINKGGRGVKAAGRGVLATTARREAKYPLAESKTVDWMRGKRKKGIKLTTRIVKGAMKKHVLEVYGGQPQVQAFKASAGWMKRFMGRWRITWRRRNDNAKKSAAELMPAVAKFICRLREFRHDHPSALVGDLPPLPRWAETDPRHNFTATYGEFDPYNTLNVDQHPLPFASTDPCTLEFIGTQRVWIKQPGSGLDKRQCTLQLLVRPLGKQPLPCLLFRGLPVPTQEFRRDIRDLETELYDKDCNVL
jgi:hypothetical protein